MMTSLQRVKAQLGEAYPYLQELLAIEKSRPIQRPILMHVANSFGAQDLNPDTAYSATSGLVTLGGSTNLGWLMTAGMPWLNSILQCPFDYLFGVTAAAQIYPTLSTINLVNGVYGASGSQWVGAIEHALPRIAQIAIAGAGGAKIVMMLTPFENDVNNNDTAGYHQTINRNFLRSIEMLVDMGITPLINTPAPSTFCNTLNKANNWYAVRDYWLNLAVSRPEILVANTSDLYVNKSQINGYPFPIGYASDAEAVALNGSAFNANLAKVYSLFNRHADASAGNGLHPNSRAQVMRAIEQARVLTNSGLVFPGLPLATGRLSPVHLTENCDFEASSGTAVSGGTGVAGGASTAFFGYQRNAFGANTQINVTPWTDPLGRTIPDVDIDATSAASGSDNSGLTSTAQSSSLVNPGTSRAQYFEDVEILRANNVLNLSRRVRVTGSTFVPIANGASSTDQISDNPCDNQLGYRNAAGLLEGKRIVLHSYPFILDPTPQYTQQNIGGGVLQANAPFTSVGDNKNSRISSLVRSAGLRLL